MSEKLTVEGIEVDETIQESSKASDVSTTPTKAVEVQTSMVDDRAEEQPKTAIKSPSATPITKSKGVQTCMVEDPTKEQAIKSPNKKSAGMQTSMVEVLAKKTAIKRPSTEALGGAKAKKRCSDFVPRCKRCAEAYKRLREKALLKKATSETNSADSALREAYKEKLRPRKSIDSCAKCTKMPPKVVKKEESPVAGPSGLPPKPTKAPPTDTSSD